MKLMLKQTGFTVVEVLIGIVVIGILAAISVVAYNGIQRQAGASVVMSSLRDVAQRTEAARVVSGTIPSNIDQLVAVPPDVQITYTTPTEDGSGIYYSNLSSPQNGLLFFDLCRDLVTEGYGTGASDFGAGTVQYISGCYVYGKTYIQINGWHGGFEVSNPLTTQARLQEYVDTAASANPDHPTYRATIQAFMDELVRRFSAQGGKFPITEYWNPWEGVPNLPPPTTPPSDASGKYCIIASHRKYADISYVSTQNSIAPTRGTSCD